MLKIFIQGKVHQNNSYVWVGVRDKRGVQTVLGIIILGEEKFIEIHKKISVHG